MDKEIIKENTNKDTSKDINKDKKKEQIKNIFYFDSSIISKDLYIMKNFVKIL